MKYFFVIIGSSLIFLSSCIELIWPRYRFPFDDSLIVKGYIIFEKHKVELSETEIQLLISKLKKSKGKGMTKGVVYERIQLITVDNDTIRYKFHENSFKDNFHGDETYVFSDSDFISNMLRVPQ